MAKSISHKALDAALEYIAERADTLVLCTGAPQSAGEAMSPPDEGGRMLAVRALATGLGNGDFAVEPGAGSGRRLVVGECADVGVIVSGLADHLALVASGSGEVLLVTALAEPCEVIEAGTVSVLGFAQEISDPA